MALLTLAFSLAACGQTPAANDSGKKEEKKANLVVAGVFFQEDQFMKLLSLGYQDAANAAGVKILTGNTGNDQGKETELINTYIGQKLDGVAIKN